MHSKNHLSFQLHSLCLYIWNSLYYFILWTTFFILKFPLKKMMFLQSASFYLLNVSVPYQSYRSSISSGANTHNICHTYDFAVQTFFSKSTCIHQQKGHPAEPISQGISASGRLVELSQQWPFGMSCCQRWDLPASFRPSRRALKYGYAI